MEDTKKVRNDAINALWDVLTSFNLKSCDAIEVVHVLEAMLRNHIDELKIGR